MKCPYCAEEIRDEAIVCRFCEHDLMFFKPVLESINSLEDRIIRIDNQLVEIVDYLKSHETSSSELLSDSSTTGFSTRRRALSTLVPALFVSLASALPLPTNSFLLLALLTAPLFVSGMWVGGSWHGIHLKAYITLGSAAGALGVIGILIVDYLMYRPYSVVETDPSFALILLPVSAVIGLLLFMSGGLLVDFLLGELRPETSKTRDRHVKIAQSLSIGTDEKSPEVIEKIAARISALERLVKAIVALAAAVILAYNTIQEIIKCKVMRTKRASWSSEHQYVWPLMAARLWPYVLRACANRGSTPPA